MRFSGNLLYCDCTDEVRAIKKRGTERKENEPDAMRMAFMLAVLPTLARRGNTGQRIHCKGDEQTEIRLQVLYCGRGSYRRASAVRAYKVSARRPRKRAAHSKRCTTNNNYYQLTRSAKNDNY